MCETNRLFYAIVNQNTQQILQLLILCMLISKIYFIANNNNNNNIYIDMFRNIDYFLWIFSIFHNKLLYMFLMRV